MLIKICDICGTRDKVETEAYFTGETQHDGHSSYEDITENKDLCESCYLWVLETYLYDKYVSRDFEKELLDIINKKIKNKENK